MPDFIVSPFDRPVVRKISPPSTDQNSLRDDVSLPTSAWDAMSRGLRGRCPRCGDTKFFPRFLKPLATCPRCGQDWTHQQADDFPAYISILLTGHIMAPVMIALIRDTVLSLAALAAIIVSLMLALMIGLLQPAKGAVIAMQWWLGMHGFVRERRISKEAGRGK